MRLLPGKHILPKQLVRYKRFHRSKGHGIHSPFVFNLLTKVIREKGSYYRFHDIELLRKRLLQNNQEVVWPDMRRPSRVRKSTIAEIVRKEAVSPKVGALLFRLVHYFQSKSILQIGSSMGLSTLYLTSCMPDISCVSLEPVEAFAAISQWTCREASAKVEQLTGHNEEQLAKALKRAEPYDFVFFNGRNEQYDTLHLFNRCMPHIAPEGICVIEGIHKGKKRLDAWKSICEKPEVTVTLDLYSVGIVFLHPKLHKRNYKLYY
ncbi:class I SAM-dependent methyltransferase [Parabacteroides sp. OttesenSCG-928-K15]|nr:class I SAM-dependent methyltransferase [Parabacteroides sp. OttesenSCG-928-K15]